MRINFWYLSSIIVSLTVLIPILTVFSSFFQDTSNYFEILKETFFFEYIFNSLILLVGVIFLILSVPAAMGIRKLENSVNKSQGKVKN